MDTALYQGKKYKIVEKLPAGNLVLQRWVIGRIPTNLGFDIKYPYRGVIIVDEREVDHV